MPLRCCFASLFGNRSLLVLLVPNTLRSTSTTHTLLSAIRRTSHSVAMEPAQFTVSYVTTPDEKTAKEIAHKIIENRLAACVNILPSVTSVYRWEGKVNVDQEAMMIIKTTTERTEALTKFVRENHPYSVAEVISMPIVQGNEPYLDWVRKTVSEDVDKK